MIYLRTVSKIFQVIYYFQWLFKLKSQHHIDSPLIYDLMENALHNNDYFYAFDIIENYRKKLLSDKTLLEVEDLGAGSLKMNTNSRSVSSIAKNTLITPSFGQFIFRLIRYKKYTRVLDLGTSLGISGAYLASHSRKLELHTIEGSHSISNVAKKTFDDLGLKNVVLHTGKFSDVLATLTQEEPFDLIFIDGHHSFEPTKEYFEKCRNMLSNDGIIILDDIHWSRGMNNAWDEIRSSPDIPLTIDLYYKGLVFPNLKDYPKAQYSLKL